jgi:hypothetical protein
MAEDVNGNDAAGGGPGVDQCVVDFGDGVSGCESIVTVS